MEPLSLPDTPVSMPSLGSERRRVRLDRRSHSRLPLRVAVLQQIVSGQPLFGVALAQSSDVGLGGMRVWRRCDPKEELLPIGTELLLSFELPGGAGLLELPCLVAFDEAQGKSRDYRMTGVSFSSLTPEQEAALKHFLSQPAHQHPET
jgi:hypothetical protein